MAFNILIVGQSGRLQYEAVLFAASLRAHDPRFKGRLFVAEPQPGPLWPKDPRIDSTEVRAALSDFGAEITPFDSEVWGARYPNGNKIEALRVLPEGEPFVFFDTDTLILGPLSDIPFEFDRPSASMERENTWPVIELYGPGYSEIWKSLYDRFDLDFASSLDLAQPDEHWERYLYFNAGWFFGACPRAFGETYLRYAQSIEESPPEALVVQSLDPWLDQIALPLVIHSLGGGRPGPELDGLDGEITHHWRVWAQFFATQPDARIDQLRALVAPNRLKKVLKEYEPFKRFLYQNKGTKARELFANGLPRTQKATRQKLKKENLWIR